MVFKSFSLESKPPQGIQRVVVRRIAPEAVVVEARAVEFSIQRVLQRELHVLPWEVVDLCGDAAAVRLSERASGHSFGCVEQRVGAAAGVEISEREAVTPAVIPAAADAQRLQRVRSL